MFHLFLLTNSWHIFHKQGFSSNLILSYSSSLLLFCISFFFYKNYSLTSANVVYLVIFKLENNPGWTLFDYNINNLALSLKFFFLGKTGTVKYILVLASS